MKDIADKNYTSAADRIAAMSSNLTVLYYTRRRAEADKLRELIE